MKAATPLEPSKRKLGQAGLVGIAIVLLYLFWRSNLSLPKPLRTDPYPKSVEVTVQSSPLATSAACAGAFVTRKLPFSTGTHLREIGTYISNGSGVAVNDLDQDGNLDLVFASVDGESTILWNEGALQFRAEPLDDKFTRGVAIVDVDGDGWLDIVFTHRGLEAPSWWRNSGAANRNSQFATRSSLPGVDNYAYAMGWADLNSDGTLDLVTGSYGGELKQHGIKNPEEDSKAGVFLYLQEAGHFVAQRLDPHAEALSVALLKLDADTLTDIWIANDFALQDLVWLNRATEWKPAKPFAETSHSTMSIDWGDLGNNGELALFTTDMDPYDTSTQNMARWLPMLSKMGDHRELNDPQQMQNVLQVENRQGGWQNEAGSFGVAATGWSWSGKFGDLDNDGWLDLYIVNGMIASDLFGHLDNAELVEKNQVLRNNHEEMFETMPTWHLDSTASGRGMVMADLDGDGDLDIVVNNLRGSAELHENQLCSGSGLTVDLRWKNSNNPYAVGARVILHGSNERWQRDVRASGGYLSDDATQLHFGLPAQAAPQSMEIIWPDGVHSLIQDLKQATHLLVVREVDPS